MSSIYHNILPKQFLYQLEIINIVQKFNFVVFYFYLMDLKIFSQIKTILIKIKYYI
jgi:hypothetical protein